MPRRIKLPKPSEEMRYTFSLLAEEVSAWPEVTLKPMFGLRAMYRSKAIFGMIPDQRSLEIADAIAYKVKGKWVLFEMKDQQRIAGALAALEKAYAQAK